MLEPESNLVITKSRYNGFYEADLHEHLPAVSSDVLVFTGCTTSVCLESTLRDDARVDLVRPLFGWVTSTAHLILGLVGTDVRMPEAVRA
jgi:nicotinamidase-related amidase